MSHSTKTVNGIDMQTWDEARNQSSVQSDARKLASSLPRGGDLEKEGSEIRKVEGPSYPGGEMSFWIEGKAINWSAPDGYQITEISVFENEHTCVKVEKV